MKTQLLIKLNYKLKSFLRDLLVSCDQSLLSCLFSLFKQGLILFLVVELQDHYNQLHQLNFKHQKLAQMLQKYVRAARQAHFNNQTTYYCLVAQFQGKLTKPEAAKSFADLQQAVFNLAVQACYKLAIHPSLLPLHSTFSMGSIASLVTEFQFLVIFRHQWEKNFV